MKLTEEHKKLLKSKDLVEKTWRGFWYKVKPKSGPIPINMPIEMRKAFFCGFYSGIDSLTLVSAGFSEDESVEIISQIHDECEREIKKFAIGF